MKPLKYGKLTVLQVFIKNGIRLATVSCECGKRKTVPLYRLTSGHAKSCGARLCRVGHLNPATYVPKAPYGPRSLTWGALKHLLDDYAKGALTIAQIAEKFAVKQSTVAYYARLSRHFGGIEGYRAAVESRHSEENTRAK